jgi:hypothetical protein
MTKKAWKKPELIVLVRGRPEEAVLAGCKTARETGPTVGPCRLEGPGTCSEDTGS